MQSCQYEYPSPIFHLSVPFVVPHRDTSIAIQASDTSTPPDSARRNLRRQRSNSATGHQALGMRSLLGKTQRATRREHWHPHGTRWRQVCLYRHTNLMIGEFILERVSDFLADAVNDSAIQVRPFPKRFTFRHIAYFGAI